MTSTYIFIGFIFHCGQAYILPGVWALLLCNKSLQNLATQNNNNHFIISQGFYESRIRGGFGWAALAQNLSCRCSQIVAGTGTDGVQRQLEEGKISPCNLRSLCMIFLFPYSIESFCFYSGGGFRDK